MVWTWQQPGLWYNIKMSSNQYRKSHCEDKTILQPSYLHNGISCTGMMSSLYWIGALYSSAAYCPNPSITRQAGKHIMREPGPKKH